MKKDDTSPSDTPGELIIYPGKDGHLRVQARLAVDTLWLTQKQMAELFGVQLPAISKHLKNIFDTGELAEAAVISILESTADDGKTYATRFYSLDAVIAVGYRVNSVLATHFRIWATQVLREYIVKGFALDDERLKNPPVAGSAVPDHFAEMLERVRDIRASERRMYLRVREVFTLAADYQPSLPETTRFFQVMQNKLHYAVTGLTAPEIVASRINHVLPNAGLTTWAGDEVRKSDITIAKNYLQEGEIRELNRIVTMWLDFAEDQAERRMYLRVHEVFTLAADYQPSLPETTRFFQVIQNKLHYAVTGLTAPEIVASRINHLLPNAGLTNFAGDEVRKSDVTIAKNYLQEKEIRELNRIVTMWLDYAEDQAERRKQVFMADWETKLDEFLRFNDRRVLPDAGKRTRKQVDAIAHTEFEKFVERRREEKEQAGAIENIRALESAAKLLESAQPKVGRKKKGEKT
ncbi:MAG: virulence RhuM family protein [Burkholderiaceae bacterium]|jgi:hypothetical protein|nr:virulence RhuM family protein [Burkholderiaceae bacterium]